MVAVPVPETLGPMKPCVLRGHADVVKAANDPEVFSSAVSRHLQIPNGLDGADHARWRPLVDQWFTSERMAELAPRLRPVADAAVAALPRDREVDAVAALGEPYAVRATCTWLGWPLQLEAELLDWMADNHAGSRSGEYTHTAAVAERFDEIIRRLTWGRRDAGADAPDDVTTELTRATIEGRELDDLEIVSILRNWTAGDLGSIALCIGVIARTMADRPAIQRAVRAAHDEATLDHAIDEILRIDDPFVSNRRVATHDVTLGDAEIAEGQRVLLHWTDANRDPARFGDPDAFDPAGNAEHNLVYGTGPHVCPGRPLATLELRTITQALLAATSWIDPGGEAERELPPLGGFRVAPVVLRG